MDEKQVKAIEAILKKGDRVELIPVKGGLRIIRIKRQEVDALPCHKLPLDNQQGVW